MNREIVSSRLAPPTGQHSHAVEVPPGSRLVWVTGQVPIKADGQVPHSFTEQCEVAWRNVFAILEEADMGVADIVKVQAFVVRPSDMPAFRLVRERILGEHRPASTMFCVAALGRPEWKVEIEVVAAKTPAPARARAPADRGKARARAVRPARAAGR
jgi:enamine deaminase RidA (YjgF/YER057c/UK114 family)